MNGVDAELFYFTRSAMSSSPSGHIRREFVSSMMDFTSIEDLAIFFISLRMNRFASRWWSMLTLLLDLWG
jgi:hypothetical protein